MTWQPDYATAAELKAYVRVGDASDDTQVALAITAASRSIDLETNRQFGVVASAEERFYSASWDAKRCRWIVPIDDLMSTTGFDPQIQDVDGTDLGAIDDYELEPRNAAAKSRPWLQLMVNPGSSYRPTGRQDEVAITGLWGWTAVPIPIKQATLLQASRLIARRDSPYGITGSPEMGGELRLLAKVDPDVAVALGPYKRWWAAC